MSVARVGEAKHPGPWVLSAINPTGVNNKASDIHALMPGICSVSETHLTGVGHQRFKRELAAECKGARFSGGDYVEPRSRSAWGSGGVQSGVGFISSMPVRPIPGDFDPELQAGTRMHAAHFWMGKSWISGGVLYGISLHSEKPEVRDTTNKLLQAVADRVLPYPGPKFLAGDWNQLPNKLPMMNQLEKMGWKDIQQVAMDRWGQAIVPTCKLSTRKDYIMLCPLLQALVARVQVTNYVFADHAILQATMQDVGTPEAVPRWGRPHPILLDADTTRAYHEHHNVGCDGDLQDWGELGGGPCLMTAGVQTSTPYSAVDPRAANQLCQHQTDRYLQLWQQHEHQVDGVLRSRGLPGLTKQQRGRASTFQRTEYVPTVHAIKPSRGGEPKLQGPCLSKQLKLWFIQLRRLVNLDRLTSKPLSSQGGYRHVYNLWRAIGKARGFYPSFQHWWTVRPIRTEHVVPFVPAGLPHHSVVVQLKEELAVNSKHLEQMQRASLQSRLQREYRRDANKVFKDVRNDGPVPVETLAISVSAEVVDVPDEGSVIVDNAAGFDVALPVLGDDVPLVIEQLADDQLWFRSTHHLLPGQKIHQQTAVASGCCWCDGDGLLVDLFDTPMQELVGRVFAAFQSAVGQKLSKRYGFGGLHDVDAQGTKRFVDKLDLVSRGMVHSLLVGVFITADQTGQAHHVEVEHRKCKFCSQPDSLTHRHWECQSTADSRQRLSEEALRWVHQQPECTTQRGWLCKPSCVREFHKLLGEIPDTTGTFIEDIPAAQRLYVFTDGAGKAPALRDARLVAWSWVAAGVPLAERFYVGAQGGVPGWWQTVVRAETCAVLSAIKYSVKHRQPITIFCDNGQVVRRFQQVASGKAAVDQLSDSDLWSIIADMLHSDDVQVSCVHVYSHQHMEQLAGWDHWICGGNGLADAAATAALESLPLELRQAQVAAQNAILQAHRCYKEVLDHLVRVGHMSVQYGKQLFGPASTARESDAQRPAVSPLDVLHVVRTIRYQIPRVFHVSDLQIWLDWFKTLDHADGAVKLVSWIELLIHYQSVTGRPEDQVATASA
eukprot:Skav206281  [mRNA]  locus=scaffold922:133626:138622:- [translate_table: standard]